MNIKYMMRSALFAALICIGAFLKIPIPYVPFTLQVLFVNMAGLLLGWKYGTLSVLIYLILGLCGLPVFTGGGGISYVLHPTFGFLLAFPFVAAISGYLTSKYKGTYIPFLSSLLSIVVMYLIALPYLYMIMTNVMGLSLGISKLIGSYCLIFIPGDLISITINSYLYKRLSFLRKG